MCARLCVYYSFKGIFGAAQDGDNWHKISFGADRPFEQNCATEILYAL